MKRIVSTILVIFLILANILLNTQNAFAAQSYAPSAGNVIITNNIGKADTIYIFGLSSGTLVKVYSSSTGSKVLTYGTVSGNKIDLTLSVPQIGSDAGSVYVSVIEKGNTESPRTRVEFEGEPKSDPISADSVTITNNAQKSDTIYISGLNPRDLIKIYSAANGGKMLGSKTVSASGSEVSLTISQVGSQSGSVYISVTAKGFAESERTRVNFDAEILSTPLDESSITVNNNAKKPDTIYISGLSGGDVVKVYNSATGGKLLGSRTVGSTSYDATITVTQLGVNAGLIYVTVTNDDCAESVRVPVQYEGELTSDKPLLDYITVTNNSGRTDTVTVTGLSANDVIKVYNSETKGSLLGSATVSAAQSEAVVSIAQLGTGSGSVYISVTSAGRNESPRVRAVYSAETRSGYVTSSNITVTNNVGKPDTIYVSNLSEGDLIKVYNTETGGSLLGSSIVPKSGIDATVTINQLGVESGTIYVSITNNGKLESSRVAASYLGESKSVAIDPNSVTVSNNVGTSDKIYITGLSAGTVVRVYSSASSGYLLGSSIVAASSTETVVTITQLGSSAGSVYLSVTQPGSQESSRVKFDYSAEGTSDAPNVNNISIANNVGKADTIYISNLCEGDIVRVYSAVSQGSILGNASVGASQSEATVSVPQLGIGPGSVYITVTSPGKAESSRVKADFKGENVYTGVDSSNITVINNAGRADKVYFTRLTAGDTVRVYDSRQGGTLLGSATVPGGSTDVTVSITQLGKGSGNVYVTVSSTDQSESERTEVPYSAEAASQNLSSEQISVTNNIAGTTDTILVTGLSPEDVIKAYSAQTQGILLGTATVPAAGISAVITVPQLGTEEGSVYISITNQGMLESQRTEAKYPGEGKTTEPKASEIHVTNNSGQADTVRITGLTSGDLVKVYDSEFGGNPLGSATVTGANNEAIVEIAQIGSAEGVLYISITAMNKSESKRTPVAYSSEEQSIAPNPEKVLIANNYGIASTITVGGLKDNDIVSIYSSEVGGTLLGRGTVAAYNSEVTVPVSQLSDSSGSVYISVKSIGRLESSRVGVSYDAKPASTPPDNSNVTIYNNVGFADEVIISGLVPSTLVKVFTQASGGNPVGSDIVEADSSEAVVSISQLGSGGGTIYVSVIVPGKTESSRAAFTFTAEEASDPIAAGNVEVVNNSGIADMIAITGLQAYDVVKIYSAASGGTRLATITADANTMSAAVNIPQLGSGAGSIYVSVTNYGKSESPRVRVQYEPESVAPLSSKITIVNNAGMSDTITVAGLNENDIVKVYDAPAGGNLLGSETVAPGTNKVTISVTQLTAAAGKVYISATNYGRAESSLTKASYIAETSTTAPYIGDIFIVNNVDIDDTVTVYNLSTGDVIKVYDRLSGGNLLGYATVGNNKSEVTIYIEDLGSAAGTVYVSAITKGKTESSRTEASYVAEGKTTAPYVGNIFITNNVTISDTILVTGLAQGDKIKIYDSATGGVLLGYGTVASGSSQLKISVKQLGEEAGCIYVTLTSKGKTESKRTEVEYVSEQTTNEPYTGYITVINNKAGSSDSIIVMNLTEGDIINVYSAAAGGSLLGSATVAAGSTSGTVTITQLGTAAGNVYITVTSAGKAESNRVRVNYTAE